MLLDHLAVAGETLEEASQYLARLTDGKYVRVWTPLANDILLVDTSKGQSLPVEILSRGTLAQRSIGQAQLIHQTHEAMAQKGLYNLPGAVPA